MQDLGMFYSVQVLLLTINYQEVRADGKETYLRYVGDLRCRSVSSVYQHSIVWSDNQILLVITTQ